MSGGTSAATLARPHVWRPAAAGAQAPPLLLLHGTGADERSLLGLGEALAPGAALLSPRGAVLEGTMPRFFRRLAEGVFDEADLAERSDELAAFVRAASAEHGLDPASWVAVGFSNGANIASSLLLRHPDVLAGAVLLGAMVPYADPAPVAPAPGRAPRWAVVSNGRRDPMATPALTATLVAQLRSAGVAVTELPHGGGHAVDGALLPELRRLVASGGR